METSVKVGGKIPVKEKRAGTGFFSDILKNKVLYIMMLPAIVVLLINNYLPMIGVFLAFKDYRKFPGENVFGNFFKSDWVGFKKFEFFLKTPDAFEITRNTIAYNAVFIVLGLIVSVGFAIILNELRSKGLSKFYQTIMFLPYFLSWVAVSYLVFAFFSEQSGFVNYSLLPALGLEPISWYSEPKYWPFILTFIQMWKYTGYNCVVYLAAIVGIDPEYYEAARIDGASKWQQIQKITLPLLSPMIVILTLLAVGKIFYADFGLFFNVTRNAGSLFETTRVIDTYVYNSLVNIPDVGMVAAAGLYQAAIGFVLVLTSNLLVKKYDPEKSLF